MPPKNAFKKVIEAVNSGKRYPVMDLVRNDPGMAAVISKLVTDREKATYDNEGNRTPLIPNTGAFKSTSQHIAQNVTDAQTVMQILPDMELSAQILVSSIIAPKDMTTTELTFSVAEGLLSSDISAAMLNKTKTYFEKVYKIQPLLPKMLRDILFETGSYPIAVIPESSIDEIINGSRKITLESLSDNINSDGSVKSIGLLGPVLKISPTRERAAPGLSLESLSDYSPELNINSKVTFALEKQFNSNNAQQEIDTYLAVTDNANLLKIPRINQKIREQRISSLVGSRALESLNVQLNDREMSALLYKDRQFNFKPITSLKTQEQLNRATVGSPLVLHLPSESVIPVYVPGCPEEHVGYFVLIDSDGNPVSKTENVDYYQELSSRLNSNGSFPSAMLTKVRSMMQGFDFRNREHLDYSVRAYGYMVENDLLARLRNGVYGNGVALAKREEVYRLMFARALAKQYTQLLFLPVELVTYFAFRYTDNGIGKSLMDDMKILNSLRSMVLFANVMSSLKNSIGRTEVKIKLDEHDPDPKKTIELAMHEIVRSRQQYFPLGMNSPTDLVDWLQRSGFEFVFEGHPGLPDVNVDFGQKSSQYPKPDTELENDLRKRAIMAVGLNPENVDNSFNAEFATSVVTNNILLSKRVIQIQEVFTAHLSGHIRKYIMNSETLLSDLREILDNNFKKLKVEALTETDATNHDTTHVEVNETNKEFSQKIIVTRFLNEFIRNLEITLPKPNSVTLENQLAALETYTKALDATLDAWISDKFFTTEMGGDVANQVNTVKEVLKAYFLRKWMAENGVMTELSKLTATSDEGGAAIDIFDVQTEHIAALTKSLTDFLSGLKPIKDKSNKEIEKIGGAGSFASPSPEGGGGGGEEPDLGLGGSELGIDLGGGEETKAAGGEEATPPAAGTETKTPGEEETPAGGPKPEGGTETKEK
jgi:hypothetical protein